MRAMTSLQPIPPERRHCADYRDDEEHAEVARILAGLPEDHPARVAYSSGAREAADSIGLAHPVADRRDLVGALVEAYLAADRRISAKQGRQFAIAE
jgi:hypothetical protein